MINPKIFEKKYLHGILQIELSKKSYPFVTSELAERVSRVLPCEDDQIQNAWRIKLG